jgi:hypothetical protein
MRAMTGRMLGKPGQVSALPFLLGRSRTDPKTAPGQSGPCCEWTRYLYDKADSVQTTTKVTTISSGGKRNLGVCTEQEPNCASRWMPMKHPAQGVPHLWASCRQLCHAVELPPRIAVH